MPLRPAPVFPLLALLASAAAGEGLPAQEIMSESALPPPSELAGRSIALVTGSTGGLGRAVATELGALGWHVIVHGRDRDRGLEVVDEIRAAGGTAALYLADFASLEEVRRLGEAVLRDHDRLHVLVNNAGIWLRGDDTRRLSADGHELTFAVNYLAGYRLTGMLLPLLRRSAPSRIVQVASGAQNPIDFDDPMLERGYTGSRAYGQSKLAQILHAFDLADALEESGVSVHALHPATLMDTDMVREARVAPRSSVEEGRDAVLRLVLDPDLGTGAYWEGTRRARPHPQARDEEARVRLRALSQELAAAPR